MTQSAHRPATAEEKAKYPGAHTVRTDSGSVHNRLGFEVQAVIQIPVQDLNQREVEA